MLNLSKLSKKSTYQREYTFDMYGHMARLRLCQEQPQNLGISHFRWIYHLVEPY